MGWRWHKWGQYIGTHKPRYEYLYDEKHIDVVYCFHIYEKMAPEMKIKKSAEDILADGTAPVRTPQSLLYNTVPTAEDHSL